MQRLWFMALCAGALTSCNSSQLRPRPQARQTSAAPAVQDWGIGAETNRSAAMKLISMPALTDARTIQEIQLHAALYRAAYQTNVGDFTRHFLLEPPPEAQRLPIAINQREFALRVLAELADLDVPIAWVSPASTSGKWPTGVEHFPNTRERATRLRIRIVKRMEDQATVQAEVGDRTADVGSSRQAVTATWDGQNWAIQRDRVRLVW